MDTAWGAGCGYRLKITSSSHMALRQAGSVRPKQGPSCFYVGLRASLEARGLQVYGKGRVNGALALS